MSKGLGLRLLMGFCVLFENVMTMSDMWRAEALAAIALLGIADARAAATEAAPILKAGDGLEARIIFANDCDGWVGVEVSRSDLDDLRACAATKQTAMTAKQRMDLSGRSNSKEL